MKWCTYLTLFGLLRYGQQLFSVLYSVSLKDPNIVGDYCEHEEKKLVFVLHSMGEFGIFKDRGNVFTLIEHKY